MIALPEAEFQRLVDLAWNAEPKPSMRSHRRHYEAALRAFLAELPSALSSAGLAVVPVKATREIRQAMHNAPVPEPSVETPYGPAIKAADYWDEMWKAGVRAAQEERG